MSGHQHGRNHLYPNINTAHLMQFKMAYKFSLINHLPAISYYIQHQNVSCCKYRNGNNTFAEKTAAVH